MIDCQDIADIPRLLLRREGVFSSVQYLSEWSFWFYVAEREGPEIMPAAEKCARFFIENYVGFDKRPAIYREMAHKYHKEWWASIPRRPNDQRLSCDFSLIDELEATFVGVNSEIAYKRPRKRQLVVTMAGAKRKSPRIEIDVGYLGNPLNIHAHHPLTDKPYWIEWFLGESGNGQVMIWGPSDIYQRLAQIRDFCAAFLPVFSACTHAKPPTPYDQVNAKDLS